MSKQNKYWEQIFDHAILITGVIVLLAPLWVAFATSTYSADYIVKHGLQVLIGDEFIKTYKDLLQGSASLAASEHEMSNNNTSALLMLKNSLILGLGFAIGKVLIAMFAAYALVYFKLRFKLSMWFFWIIFASLLLPLEVRIIPTYEIIAKLKMVDTYTGLILPLIASATATFFFRQYYLSIPDEILEAAKLDNAGPVRFFIDILLPLSKTMIAAIFIIMFVVGWNQYLWPLLMTTEPEYKTLLLGIKDIINVMSEHVPAYNRAFALVILSALPPVLVVVLLQKWFVKGLVDSEK